MIVILIGLTGSETLRPVLPSLARLPAQMSQSAVAKAAPYAANNVPSHHHRHRRDGSTDSHYMMDRDAPTPTPTTPNSLARMDDYSASLALPATDLTRRPAVAIGGVRSPKSADESVMMMTANHMNYAQK